jgi:hypothetical protein
MKPTFIDKEGYIQWIATWKKVYARMSKDIRRDKAKLKEMARANHPETAQFQHELAQARAIATKFLTLRQEAKERAERIVSMHKQLAEQNASFPMTIEDCRTIDFHFNKGSLEYTFLPMWTLKTKGMTFYINHISCNSPWDTRELAEGSTRGMIRIRNSDISIDANGIATIQPKALRKELSLVA